MLPILIAIIVVLAAAGSATYLNWDKLIVKLKGKKVAVLGARGVGKTHLIKFLTTGSIPSEYKQTTLPEKAESHRFALKDLDLKIKETLDVAGDKSAYAEWKKLHDQADVVFYLLRADQLIKGDLEVESRVRNDLKHISSWLCARKASPPMFFILGTHCDKDKEFTALTNDKRGHYADRFCKLPIVCELIAHAGGTQVAKVMIGSMKSKKDTEQFVYEIFAQVLA